MGKDVDFVLQWLVYEGLDKLVILRRECLILESFPVLYRSNYFSYIFYRIIKETNGANKKCISHSKKFPNLFVNGKRPISPVWQNWEIFPNYLRRALRFSLRNIFPRFAGS